MKNCKYCGAEIDEKCKYCTNCGGENPILEESSFEEPKKNFCTNCGQALNAKDVFCPRCGMMVGAKPEQNKNHNYYSYNNPNDYLSAQNTENRTNGFAIAGFIFSFLIPLLGWIFGGIGLSRSSKMNGKGKGLSIAALIISTISFLISFAYNLVM